MTVNQRIIELLDEQKIIYRSLEHAPTKTCADAANIRGTTLEQGAKALVCIADKKPVMIVLPCSQKLDTKTFKLAFKVKDLRFATPEEVTQITGLVIGSIPPFGSLFELPTYLNTALGKNTQIAFNAGDVSRSVIMNFADFVSLEHPQVFE
ncbi:MAG: YbaK/EbsC family protein [bacterium]|nr:YbaK/EbsC family protein [bacterium]